MHRGGNTTHHQFCPAPSPMSDPQGQILPGGQGEAVILLGGKGRVLQLRRHGVVIAVGPHRLLRRWPPAPAGSPAGEPPPPPGPADCSSNLCGPLQHRVPDQQLQRLVLLRVGVGQHMEPHHLVRQVPLGVQRPDAGTAGTPPPPAAGPAPRIRRVFRSRFAAVFISVSVLCYVVLSGPFPP